VGVANEAGHTVNKRPNALRIGLFAIGGLALLVAAIVAVFGSGLFARTEQAVMYFSGSVNGLQVGSPVVFRGVRLGRVVRLGVVHDASTGVFSVPVRAEIDRRLILDPMGQPADGHSGLSLSNLVARGLRAELATQSLLTGQMFIDLDLPGASAPAAAPAVAAAAVVVQRTADGAVQIPTRPSSLQGLMAQLQSVNLVGMANEISGAAASARQLASSPQLLKTVDELAAAARTLQTLGQTLERRVGPLADAAQATLGDTRRVVGAAGVAVDKVGDKLGSAAERVGSAAGRVDGLLAADSPLLVQVQRAADELARSASALRQATAEDGPAAQSLERTLGDVSRASRAVRDLADMLERQPEALLRGRANAP
jgi:paraquat-inducible protein B